MFENEERDSASPVVLHVVESFGAGTANALIQYVRSTPLIEHHLIRHVRSSEPVHPSHLAAFATVSDLPRSLGKARRAIRTAVHEIRPSVVHAHSSFGGAFARLSLRSTATRRIVYTPHGYSFERQDVSPIKRFAFQTVEWALSLNTHTIAACAPREATLSRALRAKRVVYVPNISSVLPSAGVSPASARKLVAGSGRLAAQRDPHYFLGTALRLRAERPDTDFVWVGGGPGGVVSELEAAGIEVTGWLPQPEALERLAEANLYVHTAAWDGFPMAILEARQLGIPVLARRSAALDFAPSSIVFQDQSDLVATALAVLSDASVAGTVEQDWNELLEENSLEIQHARLLEAYGR